MTPDEKYIQLLEKVNTQLSYSWQPMNVSIMILTALIAIGAIAAGVIIYLMGRDYRKSARLILDAEIEARDKKIKLFDEQVSKLIEKFERRLKEIENAKEVSKDNEIEQLKSAMRALQLERSTLVTSSGIGFNPSVSPSVSPSSAYSPYANFVRGCCYCGKTLPSDYAGNCCDDCRKKYLGY